MKTGAEAVAARSALPNKVALAQWLSARNVNQSLPTHTPHCNWMRGFCVNGVLLLASNPEVRLLKTFIVDCPDCRAKVAATEEGSAHRYDSDEAGDPYGKRILVGKCPVCAQILVGESTQLRFENYDSDTDEWSDIVRVYPSPPKAFSSYRIPKVLRASLLEAERAMQAGAHTAACVMLGRALEALCRDSLRSKEPQNDEAKSQRRFMLGAGLRKLRDLKVIDDRLFGWSQDLQAFRNLAAHPDEDVTISREDVEDLQAFVYAITEYVYDLADRYEEFKERQAERKRPRPSAAEMFASVVLPKPSK